MVEMSGRSSVPLIAEYSDLGPDAVEYSNQILTTFADRRVCHLLALEVHAKPLEFRDELVIDLMDLRTGVPLRASFAYLIGHEENGQFERFMHIEDRSAERVDRLQNPGPPGLMSRMMQRNLPGLVGQIISIVRMDEADEAEEVDEADDEPEMIFLEEDGMLRVAEEKEVWVSKDGRKTLIREMDNTHLWHTIRLLQRKKLTSFSKYGVLVEEAARRGLCIEERPEIQFMRRAMDGLRQKIKSK